MCRSLPTLSHPTQGCMNTEGGYNLMVPKKDESILRKRVTDTGVKMK